MLLTIDGNIKHHNVDNTLQFDLKMLETFEPVSFVTSTTWLDEPAKFTGVLLSDLLDYAGVSSESIRATAIDKYLHQFKDDNWKTTRL